LRILLGLVTLHPVPVVDVPAPHASGHPPSEMGSRARVDLDRQKIDRL
jgi:hypothetical protein